MIFTTQQFIDQKDTDLSIADTYLLEELRKFWLYVPPAYLEARKSLEEAKEKLFKEKNKNKREVLMVEYEKKEKNLEDEERLYIKKLGLNLLYKYY